MGIDHRPPDRSPVARPPAAPVLLVALILGLGLGGSALAWLLCAQEGLPRGIAVHAALMVVAWGVMLPAGSVVARYYKVTPRQDFPAVLDNPFWWNWHRGLQYGGLAVAALGLVVILAETRAGLDTWHGRCGLVVMAIGVLQVLSALLRGTKGGATDKRADPARPSTWRGDHYDMTARRRLFEAWHKRAGWTVIVFAGVTILLGIDLVGAPAWFLGLAAALQGATLFALLDGRLRERWVDTYAALWGPDPVHPGNRPVSAGAARRRRRR